ncbi:hypothetical protein SAMN06269185_1904 [Natronoarchaeum philippinense]|uniref:Uncharacterized protein n=1 Tax=Natronoarchaeum philippinense TaxID=558529 RepID=A0A285NTD8_NATPI|nr:DUF6498-containing protein [Natronoarchaeum philippinense]SNZ12750.1 hypothetical protein SAMN06269185_1904 [Natronoarchaeum philippinense]
MIDSSDERSRLALASVLGINAVPVAGLVWLGWHASTLLVLYWFEAGVVLFRGAFEGLFAALPSGPAGRGHVFPFDELQSKRGSRRLVGWLPPVYPRNVPVVLNTLIVLALVWPLAGIGVYAVVVDGPLSPGSPWSVALAAGGIVLGHGATAVESLRAGRYERESAHSVLSQRHVVGLLASLLPGALWVDAADGSGRLGVWIGLTVIVCVKLAFDLYEWSASGSDGHRSRIAQLVSRVRADSIGETRSVETPDGEPVERLRTDARAVRLRGAALGAVYGVMPLSGIALAVATAATWLWLGPNAALLAAAVCLLPSVLAHALAQDVQFGHLEYRVYETDLVAYDRLLETPQWRVSLDNISNLRTASGLIDRKTSLDTGAVHVQRRDGDSERLAFLPDAERVADRLDAPPRSTDDDRAVHRRQS